MGPSVTCVVGGEGGIFYIVYRIGEYGVGRHWRLLVTITPLPRSMCGSGILWCLRHMVLLVLAVLGIFVG